jgi:hypothetical protein
MQTAISSVTGQVIQSFIAHMAYQWLNMQNQPANRFLVSVLATNSWHLSEGIATRKMFVGHRGANQPVKNLETGLVEITTQNHGFAVDEDQIDQNSVEITHINLNDNR